ncbi:MAG: hypothetical protein LBK25_06190 [Treponema sp.]|jgi:hypothetical protein|nr:hypothetical protein [Treponema sp.]
MASFFPRRGADFLEWLKNFSLALSEHAAAWGILAQVASDLAAKVAAYEALYALATGENGTSALILEKDAARLALETQIREIKNKYIDYNDAVTDPNRDRLGLPIYDRKPSPKPRPTSRPVLEIVPSNNRQHTGTAINQASGKKTKPDDAYGVRYSWEIRDAAPANAGDLRHSVFRRKVSEVFDYDEVDRGKRIFYAACYENAKGESGPWSDIVEAIIP